MSWGFPTFAVLNISYKFICIFFMELRILRKDFVSALSLGSILSGRNKALLVFDDVRFVIRGGMLYLSSCDGSNFVERRCSYLSCDVSEFSFLVNPRDLSKILGTLLDEELLFRVSSTSLCVVHGRGEVTLPVSSADVFTSMVGFDLSSSCSVDIPVSLFGGWLSLARRFVGKDLLRPALECLRLSFSAGGVSCAASNGARLFYDAVPLCVCDMAGSELLIPVDISAPMLSVLSDGGACDNFSFRFDGNRAEIVFPASRLCFRLAEGRYPNVSSLLNTEVCHELTFSKSELLNSLHRVLLTSNEASQMVILEHRDDFVTLRSADVDFSKSAVDKCPCGVVSGGGIRIGFKGGSMIDCLSAVESDTVHMCFINAQRTITMRDDANAGRVVLLMPLMI